MQPIGTIDSCYQENFGIPRQPGLAPSARARLRIRAEFQDGLRGIEGYSHLWVLFQFHESDDRESLLIRPPRLDGRARMGVYATRSPHRPNGIGLSCVRLEGPPRTEGKEVILEVSGGDFLQGTPIVDLKPYLPYCDSVPDARTPEWTRDFAQIGVDFSSEALAQLAQELPDGAEREDFRALIAQVLAQDPRPPSQKNLQEGTPFATVLASRDSGRKLDVQWIMRNARCVVTRVLAAHLAKR